MENANVRNTGLCADIHNYIKQHPGQTANEILDGIKAMKVDGKPKYVNFSNSISSLITQLVKTNLAHYKEGGVSALGQPCFKVYPGKATGTHIVGSNMGSHLKRKRFSHKKAMVQEVPVSNGMSQKVDVQLLIAIGDKDTMIGFDTARELYEQLRLIFDYVK